MSADRIIDGDCLEVLPAMPDGYADLIYIDPPFCSGRRYEAAAGSFDDRWPYGAAARAWHDRMARENPEVARLATTALATGQGGILAYLAFIEPRLAQCRRVLAPAGSLVLHCDQSAEHWLRLLLDLTIGARCFRNSLIWCYTGPSSARRTFARKHDVLLWYSARADSWTFNTEAVRIPYAESSAASFRLKQAWARDGTPSPADYVARGKTPESWWPEFSPVGRMPAELTRYPTQKPVGLLERLVAGLSNPGDLVLDPMCGSGTALVAARRHGRRWIGVDVSPNATALARERLAATLL